MALLFWTNSFIHEQFDHLSKRCGQGQDLSEANGHVSMKILPMTNNCNNFSLFPYFDTARREI